jgi:NAD(P)-dependent dehydrogenase (short-subunit alcohol dehydrogenase family)
MVAQRILLVGGSKHIGFHILEFLAPQTEKYALFVLARTPADKIAPFSGKENVTFIQGDATDEATVNDVVTSTMKGDVDFVIMTVGIPPTSSSGANFRWIHRVQ